MTIELVDGKAGSLHISSSDKAIIHQAKFYDGNVVYQWGGNLNCTMQTANKAVISTGMGSIQGLDFHITDAETVTIDSGSAGLKRNDIIVVHYSRDASSGVETVKLEVIKGTPFSGTASDPTVPSGKILSGDLNVYMPLWRIPLDGITVGTPVRLFTLRAGLHNSISLTASNSNWNVDYRLGMVGDLMVVAFIAVRKNTAWTADSGWQISEIFSLPEGFKIAFECQSACICNSTSGPHAIFVSASGNSIRLRTADRLRLDVNGWVEGTFAVPLSKV